MSLPKVLQKILNNAGYGPKLVDSIDTTLVHKSIQDEYIDATKVFADKIVIRNPTIRRGELPEEGYFPNCHISLCDKDTQEWDTTSKTVHGRFGLLESTVSPNGSTETVVASYKNQSNSFDSSSVVAGWDENGIPYATCSPTSENRTYDNDIVTRGWIPKDTRIVHTTGNEHIYGEKRFHYSFIIKNDESERGTLPSSEIYREILISDKNQDYYHSSSDHNRYGVIGNSVSTDGTTKTYIIAYHNVADSDKYANITVGIRLDGSAYATAPETPSRDNEYDILTRNWIPKDTRIVHTTGNETINGNKTFNNAIYFNNIIQQKSATVSMVNLISGDSTHTDGYQDIRFYEDDGATYRATIRHYYRREFTIGMGHIDDSSGWGNGALLTLHHFGNFSIRAKNGTSGTAYLFEGYGDGTLKWNGQPIQTSSDERLKTPISDVNSDILDAWGNVQWGEFKYLDAVEEKGENARYHVGLIAQSVDRVFKNRGRDILKYGILCHDESNAEEPVYDENGELVRPGKDAVDEWQVRYTEALCMEAAYNRRRVSRLEEKIKLLEQKLNLAS